MSEELDVVLEALRTSRKLKRSRTEWAALLDELRRLELGALLDKVSPVEVTKPKKARAKTPEDPLVGELKEMFGGIKGSASAKIAELDRLPPFLSAMEGAESKAGWAAAVKQWRKHLSEDAIRQGARSYVAKATKEGRRTITLKAKG